MGNVELLNHDKIVAIVGSRDCTEYGRKYAQLFAKELAKKNITIISSLALGIDAAAHCGSMNEQGKTIAVLGGGLKDIYPKENLWLYNEILNGGGCVITEYQENEETQKSNFPKRNRIISGIADAVLVIEASYRSGSRITAKYAMEQGKKVYCIPINLDYKNSSGITELIREGAKIVISSRELILDLYANNSKRSDLNIVPTGKIPDKYMELYKILIDAKSSEELAASLNKSIDEINSILTIMEIEGYIERMAGNYFRRKEKNV